MNRTWPSRLFCPLTQSSFLLFAQAFTPTAGDLSITASVSGVPLSTGGVYIHLLDAISATPSSAQYGVRLSVERNTAGRVMGWSYGSSGTWTWNTWQDTTPNTTKPTRLYVHIQRTAGKWYAFWSYDGIGWNVVSGAPSGGWAHPDALMATTRPAVLEVSVPTIATVPSPKYRMGLDWVRRDWLFLEVP